LATKKNSKTTKTIALSPAKIEQAIVVVRGQRVMLDSDLASLYGVATSALNQAVTRNLERFPADFAFQLNQQEFNDLKSQFVTSSWGGRRKLPWAFTEHGLAMLSSVLRSPMAALVNIEIMRAFVRLRRLMATPGELAERIAKLSEMVALHDGQIKAIAHALHELVAEPPKPREMGFHAIERK
jgi:hypothetical protein